VTSTPRIIALYSEFDFSASVPYAPVLSIPQMNYPDQVAKNE